MTELVVGLDQGTSSTRCVVLDEALSERGVASVAVESSFPAPGLVEQDAEAIAASAERAIGGALAAAGAAPGDVAALGIANQTETFVVWDRATGVPVHPAIVWQDRRTDDACAAAARARGLRPRAHRARARRHLPGDEAALGARPRRAARTSPTATSPRGSCTASAACTSATPATPPARCCARSAAPTGTTSCSTSSASRARCCRRSPTPTAIEATIAGVPVRAAARRPAGVAVRPALLGARRREGHARHRRVRARPRGRGAAGHPAGVLGSTAWRREGTTSYALEGFIPTAGAAVDWFARLGVLPPPQELDALCARPATTPSSACPRSRASAPRAGTRAPAAPCSASASAPPGPTSPARSSTASSTRSPTRSRRSGSRSCGSTAASRARTGSSSASPTSTGAGVRRTARADSTALGAATLAGLAAGVWPSPEALPEIPLDLCAEPQMAAADRDRERDRWAAARELTAPNDQ